MPSRVKVLHLADIINRYDFIDNILEHCDRTRLQPYACTFTADSNIRSPAPGDVSRWVLEVTGRASYLKALARLTCLLRRERIDVVHTHHFDPMVLGVVAGGAARCKVIIGRHYSDSVHRLPSPWKRQLYLCAEALCHRQAARIVVPSRAIFELLTCRQGVDPEKVVRIPYGFDLTKYVPSGDWCARLRRQFAPDGQTLIGCFARLHREKGHVFLLRAVAQLAARHARLRLLVVGDGPERGSLERTVRDLHLSDSVVFTGWRTDVVDLLSAVDIAVLPSISGEGFSQSMMEALISGRPLIMTDISGARDVIQHGKTGLLVPPEDHEAIAHALFELLARPDFQRRLGEAAREAVIRDFDIHQVVRRYEDCYLSVHHSSRAA